MGESDNSVDTATVFLGAAKSPIAECGLKMVSSGGFLQVKALFHLGSISTGRKRMTNCWQRGHWETVRPQGDWRNRLVS